MWINTDEAIKIYARFCRAHDGTGAIKKVRSRAQHLKRIGDVEGHRVWNEVANQIKEEQQPDQEALRPRPGIRPIRRG